MTKEIIDMNYIAPGPDTGEWKARHRVAVKRTGPQYAVPVAVTAWVNYAYNHKRIFESDIGDDYFLGPAWCDWGRALRYMLNGECGSGIHCGVLDYIIVQNLINQGYEDQI